MYTRSTLALCIVIMPLSALSFIFHRTTNVRISPHSPTIRPSALYSLVQSEMDISSFEPTRNSTEHLYHYSLQWTPDEKISKPCRDVWKWKDTTLGDGRDFFVPKPKTIQALQDFLQEHSALTQVSVLSNCARLEIICVATGGDPLPDLCRCLVAQVQSNDSGSILNMLTQAMDIPDRVLRSRLPSSNPTKESTELERHWEVREGYRDIVYHLCLVAAGMAPRPRRPEREVIFRPFSSRDAHILLQLKRTKDVARGKDTNNLLEYALRAGKAARNPDIVPELKLLREYGTGDSKYSSEAPPEMLQQVVDAVLKQAIEPLVDDFVTSSGMTDDTTSALSLLRQTETLARNPTERSWIRKRLHQPTMDLRNGLLTGSNIRREILQIEVELNATRVLEEVTLESTR